jgi:hypothetical protein
MWTRGELEGVSIFKGYSGHEIGCHGLYNTQKKIEAIENALQPTCVQISIIFKDCELLCKFHSQFIISASNNIQLTREDRK